MSQQTNSDRAVSDAQDNAQDIEYVIATGSGEEHLFRLDYEEKRAIHAQSDCDEKIFDFENGKGAWKCCLRVDSIAEYLQEKGEKEADWEIDF